MSHHENFITNDELFRLKITDGNECLEDVFRRVVNAVCKTEKQTVFNIFMEGLFIPGIPILMNAGRFKENTLSACAVPPVDLKGDIEKVKNVMGEYYGHGMGTGFSFDEVDDPISVIHALNDFAIVFDAHAKHKRVANMGLLSVRHPNILDYIKLKNDVNTSGKKWIFNFSVVIGDDFIKKTKEGAFFKLNNGIKISPQEIVRTMAEAIHISGCPGIVFKDRLNRGNTVPTLGEYKSLAPCGELGLAEGETCQFSYLNLSKFVSGGKLNKDKLKETIYCAIRFLDDVLDYNLSRYVNEKSKQIAWTKRKIGLGVCGFSELLEKLGLSYSEESARQFAKNLFSFINFYSKRASLLLAKERGSFPAFPASTYLNCHSIITQYASEHETAWITQSLWTNLDVQIKKFGLRNCSTITLPPTGNSSYLLKTSASIEPKFDNILQISPLDQLKMVNAIQTFVDDSISKTYNVCHQFSVDEIAKLILQAFDSRVKGIAIYRDGSRENQPKKLN